MFSHEKYAGMALLEKNVQMVKGIVERVEPYKCDICLVSRILLVVSNFATCQQLVTGNQMFPVQVWVLPMCRGELSAVITRLMSKRLYSNWKWQ